MYEGAQVCVSVLAGWCVKGCMGAELLQLQGGGARAAAEQRPVACVLKCVGGVNMQVLAKGRAGGRCCSSRVAEQKQPCSSAGPCGHMDKERVGVHEKANVRSCCSSKGPEQGGSEINSRC